MTMSSMVLFLSRAIWDVGPVVEAPRAPGVALEAADLAASLLASVVGFVPNRLLAAAGVEPTAGAVVVVAPAVAVVVAAEPAGWLDAGAPNRPPAGVEVDDSVDGLGAPPKRLPALAEVVAGAAVEVVLVAGLAPNKPPAVVVAEAPEAAEVVAPPPKRPLAGVEPGVVVAGAAGLAPNKEAVELAGAVLPACEAAAGGAPSVFVPNRPPAAGVEAGAGFAPKRPPGGALLPDCAPPNRPLDDAAAVVLGWAEGADVLAGFAPPNKLEFPPDACAPVLPNNPPVGFEESAGGAPAGVVDGKAKVGLAGVAAPEAAFPKRFVVAEEGVAVAAWLALFWPNRPAPLLAVVEEPPPPKRPVAGLLALFPLFPKSPEDAGAVELLAPPPNNPPLAGAEVAAGVVDEAPPKRPPVAGVVEPPPPKIPPEEGVVEVLAVFAPPPKRLPPGFCAEAPLC